MIDCRKAALHLYEYVDRELDSQTAAEIEAHLKLCGPCFNEFDLEAKLKELVHRKAAACPGTEELKSRILAELQKIADEPVEEKRGGRIRLWAGGLAAAAASILLFVFGLPDFGTGTSPIVAQATAEHQNHLTAAILELPVGNSADSINAVLTSRLGFDPEVYYFKAAWPKLRAFHAGSWNGRSAACLFFVPKDGEGVSILICQNAEGWMPKGKKIERDGKEYIMVAHHGCRMVFWNWEGLLCCAVCKGSEEELLNFTASV